MTTETPDPKSDATVIKELARQADGNIAAAVAMTPQNREFIIRRNDFTVQEITLPNTLDVTMPKVAEANVEIDTPSSLIEYVNRFKNAHTMLFASEQENTIVAVIDYHEAAAADGGINPRLGRMNATLTLQYADEWVTWTDHDKTLMSHLEFATFLEENQWDVSRPAGADLLDLCRDLQVKQDMSFGSSIRMGDTVSINYQRDDDVSSKSSMQLPVNFETMISVFIGTPPTKVINWMRRNISNNRLTLGYKMAQRDQIEAREFNHIVAEVQAGTTCPIIFGKCQKW